MSLARSLPLISLGLVVLSAGCGPREDDLRAIGAVRLGDQSRTVKLGMVVPQPTPAACCCPGEQPWYALAEDPEVCDVYPEAGEGDRYFRGTSYLETDCLIQRGFIEARQVPRRTVSCDAVACGEGDAADAFSLGGSEAPAEVYAPTDQLRALLKQDDGTTWEVRVGQDRLGDLLERERTDLSTVSATFELLEDTTELDKCVIERRSRPPARNRKVTYKITRSEAGWQ